MPRLAGVLELPPPTPDLVAAARFDAMRDRADALAPDAGGILRVLFAADGDELGEDDTAPYRWDWDSVPYAGNEVSLLAAAEDRAGNIAYSEYVVVRVVEP